jgi:predicted ATP-grasp superfamily ATP-dependent carboligase
MRTRAGEEPSRILITNAEQRSVLASCRSLAAAGYRVSPIAFTRRAAAHSSRYCDERLQMTDPATDAERFIGELVDRLQRGRYAALIPGSDTALLAISALRERIDGLTRTGLPAHEAVERSLNREVLSAAATAAGLAAPRSVRCTGVEEASAAARDLGLPVLIKSIRTALRIDGTFAQGYPSSLVSTERELANAVADSGGECLVQATEHGEPYSFGGVMIDGRLVALAMSHYRRTWPPGAGYAAFAETIDPPHALERMVETLMNEIGWEGIFELELIRTAPDRFVPIDLNPRPYGSLALTVSAGAPLPAIWCRWLLEKTGNLPAGGVPVRARAGYRYRWEDADLRNVVWQLRRGHITSALQTALPRRRVAHAYFRIGDPLPLATRWMDIVGNRVGSNETHDAADAAPATGGSGTPTGQ